MDVNIKLGIIVSLTLLLTSVVVLAIINSYYKSSLVQQVSTSTMATTTHASKANFYGSFQTVDGGSFARGSNNGSFVVRASNGSVIQIATDENGDFSLYLNPGNYSILAVDGIPVSQLRPDCIIDPSSILITPAGRVDESIILYCYLGANMSRSGEQA